MALETKQVTVEGYKNKDGEIQDHVYTFKKFPATKGLDIQMKLARMLGEDSKEQMSAEFVKEVVLNCVSIGSTGKMDSNKFDDHFSGRLQHLMQVYYAVLAFNFDENFTEDDSEESL